RDVTNSRKYTGVVVRLLALPCHVPIAGLAASLAKSCSDAFILRARRRHTRDKQIDGLRQLLLSLLLQDLTHRPPTLLHRLPCFHQLCFPRLDLQTALEYLSRDPSHLRSHVSGPASPVHHGTINTIQLV